MRRYEEIMTVAILGGGITGLTLANLINLEDLKILKRKRMWRVVYINPGKWLYI